MRKFQCLLFGGSKFSSYKIESRNWVTQIDVMLWVTNTKILIEIIFLSYLLDFVKQYFDFVKQYFSDSIQLFLLTGHT